MANLISLSDYKTAQNISSTQYDTALNSLIASVSQLVKTYCGNSIIDYYSSNKTETFNIDWDTHVVQLTECPVNTIVSVEERDSYSSDYVALTTNNHEYFFDANTDSIIRTTTGSYRNWKTGPGAVKVVYTAGYETCPEDLKLAVIDLVTYYHKDEYKPRQTLSGATKENAASGDTKGFPDHIKRVLDLYKTV